MHEKLTLRELMLQSFKNGRDYFNIENYFETGEFTNDELVELSLSTYFEKKKTKHRTGCKKSIIYGVVKWILAQDINGLQCARIAEVIKLFADYNVYDIIYYLNSCNITWLHSQRRNIEKNTPMHDFCIALYWKYKDKSHMCLEEAKLYYDKCLDNNTDIEIATNILFNIIERGVKRRNKDCINEMQMFNWRIKRNEIPEVSLARYQVVADYLNSRAMVKKLEGQETYIY